MIPIRDNIRSRRFPIVSVTLIVINVLIFIFEFSLTNEQLSVLILSLGVVPRRFALLMAGEMGFVQAVVPLFSAMFLHGGILHLLGNMLYLWIFGDNVEDRMGRGRFILLYLGAGIAGSLAQVMANPLASEPIIGASGAIAGVLGAYFVTYPRAKVLTLVPLFVFFTFVEIPAFVFLFAWFITQSLSGYLTLGVPGDLVAWWAHIGGFVAGVAALFLFAPAKRAKKTGLI